MTATIVAVCALTLAGAATEEPPPSGIPVGKWILSPYAWGSFEYDDNIFRRNENVDPPPEADYYWALTGGLSALLPVRNSLFELDYQGTVFDYGKNRDAFESNVDQEGTARFELNFASGDQLVLRDTYVTAFTDVGRVDPGGELVFEGQPYKMNTWEVELSRVQPNRQGYLIRVARSDLNWDTDEPVTYFDYRGFDSSYEYRQPLSGRKWFYVYYDSRRFNHYEPQSNGGVVGVPYRKEVSDSIQVGVQGFSGKGMPFFVRLGAGRFRYDYVESSEFRGVVGRAMWRLKIGSGSGLVLGAVRAPLPSFYDTYYLVNEIRMTIDHRFRGDSRFALDLAASRNVYGDYIPQLAGSCPTIRKDRRTVANAYVDWVAHSKVGVRLGVRYQAQASNCVNLDYDAKAAYVRAGFGWR